MLGSHLHTAVGTSREGTMMLMDTGSPLQAMAGISSKLAGSGGTRGGTHRLPTRTHAAPVAPSRRHRKRQHA